MHFWGDKHEAVVHLKASMLNAHKKNQLIDPSAGCQDGGATTNTPQELRTYPDQLAGLLVHRSLRKQIFQHLPTQTSKLPQLLSG